MWNGSHYVNTNRCETINHQQARAMVGRFGWDKVQRGFEWPSRCGQWMVYQAGHLYKRRPVR